MTALSRHAFRSKNSGNHITPGFLQSRWMFLMGVRAMVVGVLALNESIPANITDSLRLVLPQLKAKYPTEQLVFDLAAGYILPACNESSRHFKRYTWESITPVVLQVQSEIDDGSIWRGGTGATRHQPSRLAPRAPTS
jgi:hypothetical protein